MMSANKSLEKKIFHLVENVIKQLILVSAVCSLRYEALGKFGEHSRSQSCPRLHLEQLLHIFCALQTSCVLHISMDAQTYEPIVNCSLGNCWIIIGLLFVLRFLLSNSVASNLYFRRYSTFTFVELLFSTCTAKYSKLDKIFLQKSTFTTARDEAQTC